MAHTAFAAQPMSRRILFVCLSNICRSVALEGALRHQAILNGREAQFEIDSCGLWWGHVGKDPDSRIAAAAAKKGIILDHKAREIREEDFDYFDLILAATKEIQKELIKLAKTEKQKIKIKLATDFSKKYRGKDLVDPYYGPKQDFDLVVEMSEDIANGILKEFKL